MLPKIEKKRTRSLREQKNKGRDVRKIAALSHLFNGATLFRWRVLRITFRWFQ